MVPLAMIAVPELVSVPGRIPPETGEYGYSHRDLREFTARIGLATRR
jgi:hypothetical protein